jgi:hypothetical protein
MEHIEVNPMLVEPVCVFELSWLRVEPKDSRARRHIFKICRFWDMGLNKIACVAGGNVL